MTTLVLIDTSVWVQHFRQGHGELKLLLDQDRVLMHSMIRAEIACGTPPSRASTLTALGMLRHCQEASIAETMIFIEKHQFYGRGCGYVDLALLASALITPNALFWTADRRLCALAEEVGKAFLPQMH